jgi:hypothetical protein
MPAAYVSWHAKRAVDFNGIKATKVAFNMGFVEQKETPAVSRALSSLLPARRHRLAPYSRRLASSILSDIAFGRDRKEAVLKITGKIGRQFDRFVSLMRSTVLNPSFSTYPSDEVFRSDRGRGRNVSLRRALTE